LASWRIGEQLRFLGANETGESALHIDLFGTQSKRWRFLAECPEAPIPPPLSVAKIDPKAGLKTALEICVESLRSVRGLEESEKHRPPMLGSV